MVFAIHSPANVLDGRYWEPILVAVILEVGILAATTIGFPKKKHEFEETNAFYTNLRLFYMFKGN